MQTTDLNKLVSELLNSSDAIIRQSEPTNQTFKDVISYMQAFTACFEVEVKDNIIFISSEMFNLSFLASEVQYLRLTANNLQFEHNDFTFLFDYKKGLTVYSAM